MGLGNFIAHRCANCGEYEDGPGFSVTIEENWVYDDRKICSTTKRIVNPLCSKCTDKVMDALKGENAGDGN